MSDLSPVTLTSVDVKLLQRLSDCALRVGEYQTAVEGYSLVLRLLNEQESWHEIAELLR